MVITVVAGAKEMLTPVFPPAAEIANICDGGSVVLAPWISARCGKYSHNFLLDGDYKQRATLYADYIKDKCPWGARLALVFPDLVAINGSTNAELDSFSECIALFTASLGPVALRTVIIVPETVPQEHASSIGDLSRTLAERAFAGRSDLDVQLIAPSIDDERSEALYKNLSINRLENAIRTVARGHGLMIAASAMRSLQQQCSSHKAVLRPDATGDQVEGLAADVLRSMILDSRRGGR